MFSLSSSASDNLNFHFLSQTCEMRTALNHDVQAQGVLMAAGAGEGVFIPGMVKRFLCGISTEGVLCTRADPKWSSYHPHADSCASGVRKSSSQILGRVQKDCQVSRRDLGLS